MNTNNTFCSIRNHNIRTNQHTNFLIIVLCIPANCKLLISTTIVNISSFIFHQLYNIKFACKLRKAIHKLTTVHAARASKSATVITLHVWIMAILVSSVLSCLIMSTTRVTEFRAKAWKCGSCCLICLFQSTLQSNKSI